MSASFLLLPISGEDTVSQRVLPQCVEHRAFTLVAEIVSENNFDVLRISREDGAMAN